MAHQQKLPFLSVTSFLSLLLIGHCSAQLFGGENSNVAVLTNAQFENKVLKKGERWLIVFGDDDDFGGFASILEEVAEMVKKRINVGAVNAKTGIKHRIRNFPTLKLYLGKGVTPIVVSSRNPYDIEDLVKAELLYRGRNSKVTILTKEEFQKKVMERGERWLINFCDKFNPSCRDFVPVYERNAKMLQGEINVGVVLDKEIPKTQPVPTAFSLPTVIFFPGVTVYPDVRGEPVLYTGPKRDLHLVAFARRQINETPPSSVRVFEPEEFTSEVLTSGKAWLINFCPMTSQSQSRSTCVEFAPEFERVAHRLKDFVNVGTVMDLVAGEDVEQETEYPVVKVFIGTKNKPILYTGAKDHQSLYQFVSEQPLLEGYDANDDHDDDGIDKTFLDLLD